MISAEAVEAAHEQLEAMGAYVSRDYVETALEAAAPHMLAAAPREAPHKITIDKLGDDGHGKLMSLISDIMAINGRAVVYVYPELKYAP